MKLYLSLLIISFLDCQLANLYCTRCIQANGGCIRLSYFYVQSNRCYLCPLNCQSCTSSSNCLSCSQYFYLNLTSNQCTNPIKNCKTYNISQQIICLGCNDGYYVQNNTCQLCFGNNVKECTKRVNIQSCVDRFTRKSRKCIQCFSNCISCQNGFNQCTQCDPGYYSKSGICENCNRNLGQNVLKCQQYIVLQCQYNYQISSNKCIQITNKIPNCKQNKNAVCDLCQDGYFLNNNKSLCDITMLKPSLLCGSGAYGPNKFDCVKNCSDLAYMRNLNRNINLTRQFILCQQKQGNISDRIFIKYYYDLSNFGYQSKSINVNNDPYNIRIIPKNNRIQFTEEEFPPFYKIKYYMKIMLNEVVTDGQLNVSFQDNKTQPVDQNIMHNGQSGQNQSELILQGQTNKIRYNPIKININSNFSFFVIQMIFQVYKCEEKCKICINYQFCQICTSSYKQKQFICQNDCTPYKQENNTLQQEEYTNCVTQCKSSFYQQNNQCKKCQSPCQTCISQNECLSCNQSTFLLKTQCVNNCDNQTYEQTEDRTCKKCIYPCRECESDTHCTKCELLYLDQTNVCTYECKDTFYKNEDQKICQKCVQPCQKCTSIQYCLSCSQQNDYLYQQRGQCSDQCPQNYFKTQQNSIKICKQCSYPCFQCQQISTNCTSCYNSYLLNNVCYFICPKPEQNQPNKVYYYEYENQCKLCKSPCIICIGQNQCQTCADGFIKREQTTQCIQQNDCNQNNQNNYYIFTDTNNVKTCMKCQNYNQTYCLTCSDKYQCLTCIPGYFLNGTQCLSNCGQDMYNNGTDCLSCKLFNCSKCTAINNCTQCVIPNVLFQSRCQNTQCPPLYYNSSFQCRACPLGCLNCSSFSVCIQCNTTYVMQENKCLLSCSLGRYNQTGQCKLCSQFNCRYCNSSTNCQICLSNYYLFDKQGSTQCVNCSGQLYQNYYIQNGKCIKCDPICKTCIRNAINCLSCDSCDNDTDTQCLCYLNGNCIIQCSPGSFRNITLNQCQCSKCDSSQKCRLCLSETVCLSCNSKFFLKNNTCLTGNYEQLEKQCRGQQQLSPGDSLEKNKYFPQSSQCLQCISPCQTCLSRSQCISCVDSYFLNDKKCTRCETGYFGNQKQGKCQPCPLHCQQCFYKQQQCLASNDCSTCTKCNETELNYFLDQQKGICVEDCPDGTFKSISLRVCQQCPYPCQICNTSSSCSQCDRSYVLYEQVCLNNCPSKFFSNLTNPNQSQQQHNYQCQTCDTICFECLGISTNCTSCDSKFLINNKCVQNCSKINQIGQEEDPLPFTYYGNTLLKTCVKCISPCKTCSSIFQCKSCLNSSHYFDDSKNTCSNFCPQRDQYKEQTTNSIGQIVNVTCVYCYTKTQHCATCIKIDSSNIKCTSCQIVNESQYFIYQQQQTNQIICRVCPEGYFGDSVNTLKCIKCQLPCQTCYQVPSKCLTCNNNKTHLLIRQTCIQTRVCPDQMFLNFGPEKYKCFDICQFPYYADIVTRQCQQKCSQDYIQYDPKRQCRRQCPLGFYVYQTYDNKLKCGMCNESKPNCTNPLFYRSYFKSKFNDLYIRYQFTREVKYKEEMQIKNFAYTLQNYQKANQRLLETSSDNLEIQFFDEYQGQVKVFQKESLKNVILRTQLKNTYTNIYDSQDKLIQNAFYYYQVTKWDYYLPQAKQNHKKFQDLSQALCIIMVIIVLINFLFNNVYLCYPLVDFFQLIYVLSFVDIQYPPNLNWYMYGFRYSHYLFLPQIFKPSGNNQYLQKGPGKFGVITKDVNFLRNVGHNFLILFIVIGLAIIFVLIGKFFQWMVKRDEKQQKKIKQQLNEQIIEDKIGQQQKQGQLNKNEVEVKEKTKFKKLKQLFFFILNRFRWNYINDVIYIIFFYMFLFSIAQFLDFPGQYQFTLISSILAVIILVVLMIVLILAIILLFLKRDSFFLNKTMPKFKCFFAGLTRTNYFSLFLRISNYFRKMVVNYFQKICILIIFLRQKPIQILSFTMIISGVYFLLMIYYQPYKWKLQNKFYILTQVLIVFFVAILSVIILQYQEWDSQEKIICGWVAISFSLIYSILLILYNLIMLVIEAIYFFSGRNLIQQWYKASLQEENKSQGPQSQKNQEFKSSNSKVFAQNSQEKQINSYRLQIQRTKQDKRQVLFSQSSQNDYNPILKKGDAPKLLMKLTKNIQFYKEQENQPKNLNDPKEQSQNFLQKFDQ